MAAHSVSKNEQGFHPMLVFIDESGDPGLKFAAGSTDYFIVVVVAFEDHEEAQDADDRIKSLRQELGLPEDFEFHFSKLNHKRREVFLRTLATYSFFYLGIVINKRKLTGPGLFRDSFYKYACSLVFENAKPYLDNAVVVVDGSGTRKFRKQLQVYLKKRVNDKDARRIKKVKVQNSATNDLLQLADMICGAVARSYGKKEDAQLYRRLIVHRELYVQFWPK